MEARRSPGLRGGRLGVAVLAASLALFALPGRGSAQFEELLAPAGEAPEASADPLGAGAIAERLRGIETELSETALEAANAQDPELRAHLEERRSRLERIQRTLRLESGLVEPPEPTAEEEAESAEPAASVFALNALLERRFALDETRARTEERLADRREALESAKSKLEAAEQARREARVAAEAEGAEPGEKLLRARVLELRELDSRLARERVGLRTLEVRETARLRDAALEVGELDARIAKLRELLAGGGGDARAGFAALADRAAALERARADAERRTSMGELELERARRSFAEARDPEAGLAEVEALAARQDLLRRRIEWIGTQQERLEALRELWRQWDVVAAGRVDRAERAAWEQLAADRVEAFERASVEGPGRISQLQRRLQVLDERIAQAPPGTRVRRALDAQREELAGLLEERIADTARLQADVRLAERVLAELERTGRIVDLRGWLEGALGAVMGLWNYEVTNVDDFPITVRSLLVALFLLGTGLWVARRGSAAVSRWAMRRLRLDLGAANALQTLSFYALLISFALLSLRSVHFPLTAFTVLGGALAIGVGFGSQNVMNNFISGLILMLERPIRARDLVEIEGNYGTIEQIGARSTRIRSVDGRHIIVPNSFFLENNVVNWTLSDDLVRTRVSVGVIYGSPTRLVEKLIQRAIDEDADIHKQPAPVIIFNEFGDNSLNFDVHFWVTARSPMDMRRVESRVRFRIDDLFREHGLVIAFPQRDVHLDTPAPIQVTLVDREPRAVEPG